MNAALVMQTCPEQETLAAFIDGRLDERSRKEVIAHLVDCGECADAVVAANEYSSSVEPAKRGEVVPGRFGKRVLAPLIAAAAAVVVVVGMPSIRERITGRNTIPELVKAANQLKNRPAEGRFSVNFAYRDYSVMRGSGDEIVADEGLAQTLVEAAAFKAIERADKNRTAANMHAAGIARIFLKRPQEAVLDLESAAKADPTSAAILNDLAAAYIAIGGDRNYALALKAANDSWALEQTPTAAWNRAIALQWLNRNRDAIAAWQDYLKLDPSSPWAGEVRKEHLPGLQEP